jgi:hypothetical protein
VDVVLPHGDDLARWLDGPRLDSRDLPSLPIRYLDRAGLVGARGVEYSDAPVTRVAGTRGAIAVIDDVAVEEDHSMIDPDIRILRGAPFHISELSPVLELVNGRGWGGENGEQGEEDRQSRKDRRSERNGPTFHEFPPYRTATRFRKQNIVTIGAGIATHGSRRSIEALERFVTDRLARSC